MKVPFLDLKIQYQSIKDEVYPAIQNLFENTAFILGKPVSDFEKEFARVHNAKHCLGVSSGTDGNHVVLWANNIKHGDEVIIPNNTFIATAWGATLCGANPVFVDCEPDSYNIDPEKIEKAITPKTKAIVAVHLYGQPANMDLLLDIAKRKNILLVEDCAQSHIAEYKGKRIGTFGIASSFSFYPGKNLGAYGEGGAVMTNDDELAEKFKKIRDHGSTKKYTHEIFGHNYRMEAVQGAILGIKLKYLEKWVNERRQIAGFYNKYLSDFVEIILPKEMDYSKHVYHLFVIQTNSKNKNNNELRDKLQKHLSENGVGTGLHYPIPLHLQPCFNYLGYKKGDFPVSEKLADTGLSLPMFPELKEEEVKYVCEKIKSFYK